MSLNPYTVLELPSTATAAEIKAAYKRLAFQFHPDRNRGSAYHTQRFQQIVEAYDILSDPDKRARFDRRFSGTSASATGSASPPPHRDPAYRPSGGPSAYRHSFTGYDPLRGNGTPRPSSTERGYTGRGGRRFTYPSAHQVFIAFTLLACFAMASLWFGAVMDRRSARQALAQGNPLGALDYDTTYGEAWFELGMRQAERGMYENALRNMGRGMRLAEDVHANWYWSRGRLAERMTEYDLAQADYYSLLRWTPADSVPVVLRDSLRIRLASLMVQAQRPDSAFGMLAGVSEAAAAAPAAQYLRGLSALRSGRFTESIASLQAAADALYYPAEAYYHLGYAFLATADSAKACIAWDIALTSGAGERADSLLRRYCTFGKHTSAAEPLVIYVKP